MFLQKFPGRSALNLLNSKFKKIEKNQIATLKAVYDEKFPYYPHPFPYERKRYTPIYGLLDNNCVKRYNENTKIVTIEGLPGVGKTNFAKRFAKDFDLKLFPPTPVDNCFIDKEYNYDLRNLNNLLPEEIKFYDLKDFYNDKNLEYKRASGLAIKWYYEKYKDYQKAFRHLLHTGQGVTMVSSVFSDIVYVETLKRMKWCTPHFFDYYMDYRDNSICDLYMPHLTIFLDISMETFKKRIKNKAYTKDTINLTEKYLKTLKEVYIDTYLPFAKKYGELIIVDWNEIGDDHDIDAIVEECSYLKLYNDDKDDIKFRDWNRNNNDDYITLRLRVDSISYTNYLLNRKPNIPVPEFDLSQENFNIMEKLQYNHPVFAYKKNWAPLNVNI